MRLILAGNKITFKRLKSETILGHIRKINLVIFPSVMTQTSSELDYKGDSVALRAFYEHCELKKKNIQQQDRFPADIKSIPYNAFKSQRSGKTRKVTALAECLPRSGTL